MASAGSAKDAAYHELFCPKCAYDLHGLQDCRCPECGQPFDPALLKRINPELVLFRRQFWRVGLHLMPIAMLIGAFDVWSVQGYRTSAGYLLHLALILLLAPPMFAFALVWPLPLSLGVVLLLVRARTMRSVSLVFIGWLLLWSLWYWVLHIVPRLPD